MSDLSFNVFEGLPYGFLEADASQMRALLGGPSLIHLEGEREPALFVSVLLHGNEISGLLAIQRLLKRYRPGGGLRPLPRSLNLFVGNVFAAEEGVRRLPQQPDYNRVWPTPAHLPPAEMQVTPEHLMMAELHHEILSRGVFASIDLHNNTGKNPHYTALTDLSPHHLHLAALFGRTVVYFTRPRGVQTMAFAAHCPSVTVEAGQPGVEEGIVHSQEFVDAALHLAAWPSHPVPAGDLDVYHTVAVLRVGAEVPIAVEGGEQEPDAVLHLPPDVDGRNFRELPAGTPFIGLDDPEALSVTDDDRVDVFDRYFELVNGQLLLKRPAMPSMLTRSIEIIRQDCLCYLMERIGDPAKHAEALRAPTR